jgi:SNF2 family DNA or RNA helicase
LIQSSSNIQIRLAGVVVEVSGASLDSRQLRLFFRGILGGEFAEDVWRMPTRGADGNDLVARIARRLGQAGLSVEAQSDEADLALKHEIERVRSFARAHHAGEVVLALEDHPDVLVPDEARLLEVLDQFGWNSAERMLRPHQMQGLLHGVTVVNAANFSVPGAGKTATALAVVAAHMALNHIDAVVVVGPLAAFRPWEHETRAALPGKLRVSRVRGSQRGKRISMWREVRPGQVLLCSYATAAGDRSEIERLCRRLRVMLIVDESHRVKRFNGGLWATALMQIARVARVRMILTGTPMPQSPLDLWSQFNILWPGEEATGSRLSFRARADGDFKSLIRSIEPFYIRTPKSALGLSPPRIVSHRVEMDTVQRQIYELIVSRLRRSIPDRARWQDKIDALRRARPMRLIQAASNPDLLNSDDGFYNVPALDIPSATLMERLHRYRWQGELPTKFRWALEKLEELSIAGNKCVVWTNFVRNVDQFTALARERIGVPVYSVDGRVVSSDDDGPSDELDETRERRIDLFLQEEGSSILVANPAACGESISLHSHCHTAIYLDRTYDCARWLQSIDRIHRLGLPEDVIVEIHLPETVVDGTPTIDGLIEAALTQKAVAMSMLLEGAELRGAQAPGQDSLAVAQGSYEDLDALLRYLLGEK